MAMTPRIITANTALAAVTLLFLLLGSIWFVVEFAPSRTLPEPSSLAVVDVPPRESTAPRVQPDLAFSPDEQPDDPALCAWTADQVFRHFEVLARAEHVESHTGSIARLIDAYIDLRCPTAIHQGDWILAAQILGVGVIYETLRPQAEVYDASIEWNPRADALVPAATSTFEVLAPHAMCAAALRQDEGAEDNAFSPLVPGCLGAFQ